jgi:putative phosphoesterase
MNELKVAIVSDSHDNKGNLEKATAVANEKNCSYLFHLGDIISPFTAGLLREFNGIVKAVFGNCDGDLLGLQKVFNTIGGEIEKPPWKFELEGKRIILMHEPSLLEDLVKAQESDFIFYGHLHKIDARQEGKTFILNPGETGGWMRPPSFFIVDLFSGRYEQVDL